MGQGASGSSKDKPKSLVPTSTQLKRAELQSKWWALQISGVAPAPLCLQAYGAPYAAMCERHCGQHRLEHQKCLQKGKLDPLNMQAWYPVCGEPFELENACVVGILKEVDRRCSSQLDKAAAVLSRSQDQADPKLKEPLEALGRCISQMAGDKNLKIEYDAQKARSRFDASKRLMSR
eukprot:TRINITY_DN28753_c0_g1_i1.p1 TRINITY_DN28753_c0_g1~~TRINITY_DN28753_c0_g1_i1.p1  ORF type:complete len:177 (+),score=35.25 TRINITY_DN28753_c0_g1_i1:76-606(+)